MSKRMVFKIYLVLLLLINARVQSETLFQVEDKNFQELKSKVLASLEGTWCSSPKAELMMDLVFATRPKVCVEIGVFTGASVLPVAAALDYVKHGEIYAVDAWSNFEAIRGIDVTDINYPWWQQVDMHEVKLQFENRLEAWSLGHVCHTVHTKSSLAAKRIGQIDFLHLDGNFSEEGSLKDTKLYLPKVRSGGYILLSNLFVFEWKNLTHMKMSSLWLLLDECEVVCELGSEAVLLRKN